MQKWVRVPTGGQFRGEGEWMTLEAYAKGYHPRLTEAEVWAALVRTNFLPIVESSEYPKPN